MRRAGRVAQRAQQVQTLAAVVERVQTESAAVNAVALQGAAGEKGATGQGFRIFTTGTSLATLSAGGTSNAGEFGLVKGGDLYVWMGSNLGNTGPNNAWEFVGDVTDEAMIRGATGPTGPAGTNGTIGVNGATGATGPVAGTNTNIIFNQSSNASGSPNLVYDYTNSYLGVNISTPSYPLHVSGTGVLGGMMISGRTLSSVDSAILTRAVAGVDPFAAGGGTATTYIDTSGNTWGIHTFSTAGTFTFSNSSNIANAQVLVVGGGGGGGGGYAGGGGAGGAVYTTPITLSSGTYTITVGAGGAGGSAGGSTGSNSSMTIGGTTYTGNGGGAGGSYSGPADGGNGGCGGGSGNSSVVGTGTQGFNGGAGGFGNGGGGGGGMGQAGASSATGSSSTGLAKGGDGLPYTITGTYYAGGGGGGVINTTLGSRGGNGGGGYWDTATSTAVAGTDGLGGGGGGAIAGYSGAKGGTGTVVIAYPLAQFGTFVNQYGNMTVDATCNLTLSSVYNIRLKAPTEYRRVTSNISVASVTLSSTNYSTLFTVSGAGLTSVIVPSLTVSDAGAFWDFQNITNSTLSFSISGTSTVSSPVSLPTGGTYNLTWNGTRYVSSSNTGGGSSGLTVSAIQTLSEVIIANTVSQNLSTATVIQTYTIPSAMKGKAGFLTGYFYLKNQTAWSSNLAFNYGFAIDNTLLGRMASNLPYYKHTSSTDTYALTGSGSAIVGTGGFTQPLTIPVTVPSNATNFAAVVSNSSTPMQVTQVGAVATTTFTYTGSLRTYTVPANITSIQVHLWGAGGMSPYGSNPPGTVPGSQTNQGGGPGGYTTGYLNVTPGQVLYLVIGGFLNNLVTGNGGQGNSYQDYAFGYGPRGGGFTGLFTSNIATATAAQAATSLVAIAGGGGGAGMGQGMGGEGGGSTGGPASSGGATGGTQTTGGIGTNGGSNGTLLTGGNGPGGGGGGGGYYGGGGASAGNAPGAGGSGYTGTLTQASTISASPAATNSSWAQPPQYALMQSLFGANTYYGGSYQYGAAAITTQGTYPTFIGSEITVTY